jgi:predicted alpha/beta-fold hydrolase
VLVEPFQQRWPWLGPDLQTLRDTLRPLGLPPEQGVAISLAVGSGHQAMADLAVGSGHPAVGSGHQLLALQDLPLQGEPKAWVVLLHGLGGSSGSPGVRRLALLLQGAGFGVWRLNLRGAGPGRALAPGTYAASCNTDLLPVMAQLRDLAAGLPLLGVGLSLGGTMLLNLLCEQPQAIDGLVTVSSPVDLAATASQIEQPRNRLYQRWLLRRLVAQTLADPGGLGDGERQALTQAGGLQTIRAFDAAITAPRWSYASVDHYYAEASPLAHLLSGRPGPPTLLVHAADDPWVPAAALAPLATAGSAPRLRVCITARGGHNGFHGIGDDRSGSWSDRLTLQWLEQLL